MGYEGRIPALSMQTKSSATMTTEDQGGRVFFSSTGRSLEGEDEIVVLSVGVDIGSSTSHLVFSRIVLERLDSRYVVSERETFYASDILLTPYSAENTIDADALGTFIKKEYLDAKVDHDEIDTGALILTGVAVQRKNARAIGDLCARQAGKLVAVSAGDSLETVMAAYGSGAAARSIRDACVVMNVDVGGGTSKIAVCADGKVVDLTAVDVGARLVCLEPDGKITRVEEAGARHGRPDGRQIVRRHARRHADGARRQSSPHRSAHPPRAGRADPVLRRRVGVHLRQRGKKIRRPRPIAGGGNPRPGRCVLPAPGALHRRHPRHRRGRVAIHHPAQRQHDLCGAARRRAAPQRAGDRAGIAARS